MKFKTIMPESITENTFKLIGGDWMLITAKHNDKFNTMTASWGNFGVLWHKPTATVYIRPQRYTREFIDFTDTFTLSFFDEKYREKLTFCGKESGRNTDKIEKTGITPVNTDNAVYFEEAKLVVVCKKIYTHDLNPENFRADYIEGNYPDKDYHRMYIGEITEVLFKN